jgi:DNA-binding transcriptional ArsR family regulator
MAGDRHPVTVEQLKAFAHPLRIRILRLCLDQPRTNQELAVRLQVAPGTMLRHVRQLAQAGFLAAQEPRPGPQGTTERPYLATGLSWRMNLDLHGPELAQRAELAVLDAYRAELAETPPGGWAEGARTPLWLTPAERDHLVQRMAALIAGYGHPGPRPGAQRFSFLWSMHAEPGSPGTSPDMP